MMSYESSYWTRVDIRLPSPKDMDDYGYIMILDCDGSVSIMKYAEVISYMRIKESSIVGWKRTGVVKQQLPEWFVKFKRDYQNGHVLDKM